MGIDLRLTGAMLLIAYVAYVFIGQSASPLASSRRRVRRLQLWYARSIALVLALSSLVSAWVATPSLKEGVLTALSTAILPLAGVSLVFSALVLKRLHARWRGKDTSNARRSEAAAPMSLTELHERQKRIRQEASEASPSEQLVSEMDELEEQLEEDLGTHGHQDSEADDGGVTGVAPGQSRQRRA